MNDLFDLRNEVAVVIGAEVPGCWAGRSPKAWPRPERRWPSWDETPIVAGERVRAIQSAGGQAAFFAADALQRESLAAAREAIVGALGQPTVLVNAAGGNNPKVTVTAERPSSRSPWKIGGRTSI